MNMYQSLVVRNRSRGRDLEKFPYILQIRKFDNPVEAEYDDVCYMTRQQAIAAVSTNLANAFLSDLKEFQGKALE